MSASSRLVRWATRTHTALYRRVRPPRVRRMAGLPVLLLTVTGRRSGKAITTPVCYVETDTGYAVTGSAGGSDSDPQWFRNLRAAPEAVVEVGENRMRVRVRELEGEDRNRVWRRFVTEGSGFDGYERRTERVIPVALLTPLDGVA